MREGNFLYGTVNSIMKDKRTASSFDELNLNESLILAQDERWRRA